MRIYYFSFGFIGYKVSMWNLLHISSFCFICYLVGYVKPFLYIFSFWFICYEVGMWNPFYIFLVFVLYVTRWVC